MFIASPLSTNYFTGRKVWAIREISTGNYGDKWTSSFVAIRPHWGCKEVELQLAESINTTKQRRLMQTVLKVLGFTSAWGTRNGKRKEYKI